MTWSAAKVCDQSVKRRFKSWTMTSEIYFVTLRATALVGDISLWDSDSKWLCLDHRSLFHPLLMCIHWLVKLLRSGHFLLPWWFSHEDFMPLQVLVYSCSWACSGLLSIQSIQDFVLKSWALKKMLPNWYLMRDSCRNFKKCKIVLCKVLILHCTSQNHKVLTITILYLYTILHHWGIVFDPKGMTKQTNSGIALCKSLYYFTTYCSMHNLHNIMTEKIRE